MPSFSAAPARACKPPESAPWWTPARSRWSASSRCWHIPRIYGEFRKLVRAARTERPDIAILTDSPDFHLRLARKLHAEGIPVVYLIAPQAWAWRQGRVKTMRRTIRQLLCIFPFEETFFQQYGVPTTFIGHPLARIVKPSLTRAEFCEKFGLSSSDRFVVLLPGSRHGEVARHMPYLLDAAKRIQRPPPVRFLLALPAGFGAENTTFWEPVQAASIQVIEGHTWDALAQAELALAASGTVTIEAAMLGTPMVTFYRVNALSWILGRWLVKAPFLSMVNLVAGRRIVPELIQGDEMTGEESPRRRFGCWKRIRGGLRCAPIWPRSPQSWPANGTCFCKAARGNVKTLVF